MSVQVIQHCIDNPLNALVVIEIAHGPCPAPNIPEGPIDTFVVLSLPHIFWGSYRKLNSSAKSFSWHLTVFGAIDRHFLAHLPHARLASFLFLAPCPGHPYLQTAFLKSYIPLPIAVPAIFTPGFPFMTLAPKRQIPLCLKRPPTNLLRNSLTASSCLFQKS